MGAPLPAASTSPPKAIGPESSPCSSPDRAVNASTWDAASTVVQASTSFHPPSTKPARPASHTSNDPLADVLNHQDLHQTRFTQPALFALQTALVRQWRAWGIQPDFLLGHSIGEIVAAHLAGVLSLRDAATLVCARAQLMHQLATPGGAMASIEATETRVRDALEHIPGHVDIAALNTPRQTVVSGDVDAVDAVRQHFHDQGERAHGKCG
jgi:acyl transferase domain-containing protein